MLKVISVFIILFSTLSAVENQYEVFAKNGNIIVDIQGMTENISENSSYLLAEGITITLISGTGKAIIKNNNKILKTLLYKNHQYKIPSEGLLANILKKNYWNDFACPKVEGVTASSKGVLDSNVTIFDINTSYKFKYFTLHSTFLHPLPVIFTLKNKNNIEIVSYEFNEDAAEEVFFIIPTKLFKNGQTYTVECGSRTKKTRLQGKVNIKSN